MQTQHFNGDATADELGTYRFVEGWVQCGPGADAPWPVEYIRHVHEFDPMFRLMWVVNVWKTPSERIEKTGQYMLARQVINPQSTKDWIKNPKLPIGPVGGVSYRPPFLSAMILDARTPEEMQKGVPPKFQPFTGVHVESMRAGMWFRNNKNVDRDERERVEANAQAIAKNKANLAAESRYRRVNDEYQIKHAQGRADRVYVSSTLQSLREAAGMEAA